MASLAQQESQSLSQNVKLGLQFRYQEGKVQVNHNHFLGYTKDSKGNLIIDEEEAKVVRRIYREYLEGYSFRDIKKGLERDGILTGAKNPRWHVSTIIGILKNEKYMGDALLQKTITTDFIQKTRIKNDGSLPQYYVKDSQPAIIPKDIYTLTQETMARRSNLLNQGGGKRQRIYSGKYALSSICTCTNCGDVYRRVAWNNHGKTGAVWRCSTRIEHGPTVCNGPNIKEKELQMVTVKAINEVVQCSSTMMDTLRENIIKVITEDQTTAKLAELEPIIASKQHQLAELAMKNKDFSELSEEIKTLQGQRDKLKSEKANTEEYKKRITEMNQFLDRYPRELTEYDEEMVRRYIKGIKIYDDHFEVSFKAGINVNIGR